MDSSSSFAITDEEFNLFHYQDRKLFTLLISKFSLDLNESIQIMGFWLWLKQVHLKDLSIIHKVVTLSHHLLRLVIEETRFGMNLIEHDTIPPEHVAMEFHLLQKLTRKPLSLQQLHAIRLTVFYGVSKVVDNVCVRAFRDIIENFTNNLEQNRVHPIIHSRNVGEPFVPVGQGVLIAPTLIREMGEPSKLTGHDVPMRMVGEHYDWQGGVIAPASPRLVQGGDLLVGNIPIMPVMVGGHEIRPHFYPGPVVAFHLGAQFQGPTYPLQFGENMSGMVGEQMQITAKNEMTIHNNRYDGMPDVKMDTKEKNKISDIIQRLPYFKKEIMGLLHLEFLVTSLNPLRCNQFQVMRKLCGCYDAKGCGRSQQSTLSMTRMSL